MLSLKSTNKGDTTHERDYHRCREAVNRTYDKSKGMVRLIQEYIQDILIRIRATPYLIIAISNPYIFAGR